MDEKCTYIDEIVVQTPHDCVSEFIERARCKEIAEARENAVPLSTTKNFSSHSALPNINIKDCTQITFNSHY